MTWSFDDVLREAVQEALVDAAAQWPSEGVPDSPPGWLITVASRRLADRLRGDAARLPEARFGTVEVRPIAGA
ncbi:hypothetical protein ACFHW2_16235 [Actinomadura sp. LOL_016]|uniref:hypothetical protein n=1 Tax=unclassified Actinomadura TaxID=2626254 RepID=UPI003A7F8863